MPTPISKMTSAGTLAGTELLELTKLSSTITITASTISASAADNSYNDSGGGFLTAGFAPEMHVNVTGFTGNVANNITSGKIQSVTANKMIIASPDGDVIVNDAAGESVTITAWITRRTTTQDVAGLASGGSGIGGSTGSVDNRVLVADGTGGATVKASAVAIESNGEIYDYRAKRKVISGTTGSIDSNDSGWLVEATNGSAVAIEFDNGIPVDACGTILQSGAGQITFSVESGGTLRNRSSHTKSAGQYALISWVCKSNSGGSAAEIVIGGDTAS